MTPDVAIVIVTYNSEQHIGGCLASVYAETGGCRAEIVVVDNSSTDNTVRLIRQHHPRVRLLIPGRNLGFAAGVNFGARHTKAQHILLLNPDTILLDKAVDKIVQFGRRLPEHGIYGGRTLRPNGSLEPSSCWAFPSLWSLAMFAAGLSTLAPRNRWLDPESLGDWARDTVQCVGIVTGCFLLIQRDLWDQLGGFDERYFMYGEDADLAARAQALGYQPIICPDARLVHEIGQSSSSAAAKLLLLYQGKASFLRTHWKGVRQKLGLLFLATGVGLRALLGPHQWRQVWRERRCWLRGYNRVRQTEVSLNPPVSMQTAP